MRRLLRFLLALLFLTTTLRGAGGGSRHCEVGAGVADSMPGMAPSHHGHGSVEVAAAAESATAGATHDCPHCPATACHSMTNCGGITGGIATALPTETLPVIQRSGHLFREDRPLSRSTPPTLPPPRAA